MGNSKEISSLLCRIKKEVDFEIEGVHSIMYCLPTKFYREVMEVVDRALEECRCNGQVSRIELPNPSCIEEIIEPQNGKYYSKRYVKSNLEENKDFNIVNSEFINDLRVLYHTYSTYKITHVPKISIVNKNGSITLENSLPTIEVSLLGLQKQGSIFVKCSLYTTVAELIEFVTSELRIEQNFNSIKLYDDKQSLCCNDLLIKSNTHKFTLRYTENKITKNSIAQVATRSIRERRLNPVLRDLWSCSILA